MFVKIMAKTGDSSFPKDLLQRFMCGGGGGGGHRFQVKPKEEAHGLTEKVELSLGLSLNGRFGMEPQKLVDKNDNKLFRASSVTDLVNIPVDVELSLYSPLTRTCSLPPETEAEWKKRKELQSFRRSEAKRKRVEKLKNVRVIKGKIGEGWDANRGNLVNGIELIEKQSPPSPVALLPTPILSQGSIGSQGSGGSSGISDLDSQPFQGTNKEASETPERSNLNQVQSNQIQIMPCVSTKGDGPESKKILGFLYRYGKGEEVRIVCVCHGSFLTPAEFVKHGGGAEVEHPLRHIIVDSSCVR